MDDVVRAEHVFRKMQGKQMMFIVIRALKDNIVL